MSATRKSRTRRSLEAAGIKSVGSPVSTELITPRRSSRSRKTDLQENVTPAVASGEKLRDSVASNNRRSARLRNSAGDSVLSPRLSGSSNPRKSRGKNHDINDVKNLSAKDSDGGRRESRRKSGRGKRKLSQSETVESVELVEKPPVPEKVVGSDLKRRCVSESDDVGCGGKTDIPLDEVAEPEDGKTSTHEAQTTISPAETCEASNPEVPVSKKTLESNVSIDAGTDVLTKENDKSSEGAQLVNGDDPMDVVDAFGDSRTSNNDGVNTNSINANSESEAEKTSHDVVSDNGGSLLSRPDLTDVRPEASDLQETQPDLSTSRLESQPIVDKSQVQQADSSQIESQPSEGMDVEKGTEHPQNDTSLPSMSKLEEDRTDPIDALVKDLAANQTNGDESSPARKVDRKKKDSRRRSSFIRGRLSQAPLALEAAELSNCIPLEFPADQRLEMLVQKAARHALDRLVEEFSEVEEDNHFVTDALDATGTEITKLKEEKVFEHATNKISVLPNPENVSLDNRISQIQKTVSRLNTESEDWDKVIEKHRLAAEEAQRQSEQEQLLVAEGPISDVVQSNSELLQRTKQQFVTMIDKLQIVTRAVDSYNSNTASLVEKVVQENGAKLLGQNEQVDPMKLIQSLPIMECEPAPASS